MKQNVAQSRRNQTRMKRIKKKNTSSRTAITMVIVSVVLVLCASATSSYAKNQEYKEQEIKLQAQLNEERERTKEIETYKEYTQTDEYVEEIAREKLGLVYPDEIILQPMK